MNNNNNNKSIYVHRIMYLEVSLLWVVSIGFVQHHVNGHEHGKDGNL